MAVFLNLTRKNLFESRWMLGIVSSSLFGLCWLFVYVAHKIEQALGQVGGRVPRGMLRGLGGSAMDFSTAAIEMAFWNHPFVLLLFAVWAIGRGSGSVAGEIERGTLDLVLSRPVARGSFLGAQVMAGLIGLFLMAGSMIVGNLVGAHYNPLVDPASAAELCRPALNLVAFGWAIFGYTFLASSLDHARWRPNLIGSVVTLAMFIALVVSGLPTLEDWKWLEQLSIFKAYNPVEAVTTAEHLAFNISILGGIGLAGVVAGSVIFSTRDLPAGS